MMINLWHDFLSYPNWNQTKIKRVNLHLNLNEWH